MLTRIRFLRVLTLVLALAVTVPIAACGGDDGGGSSKSDYKKDADAVSKKFQTDFTTAQQALQNASTPEANLAGLESMQKAIGEAADGLGKLDPPDDFKDVHQNLVDALNKTEGDVNAITEAAKAKDEAKVEQLKPTIQQSFQELGQAGDAFDKKVGT